VTPFGWMTLFYKPDQDDYLPKDRYGEFLWHTKLEKHVSEAGECEREREKRKERREKREEKRERREKREKRKGREEKREKRGEREKRREMQ
jgi:hypothetical protein